MELGGVPTTGEPRFGILGPLTAAADAGQRLELGGHKQRELLAFLLIHRNRCTPASRIADALWHGAPPAGADVTLRTHVSHLRRWLAGIGARDALVTRQAGYGLYVGPDQVDATQFERLLEQGRAALGLGDAERASQLLAEALNLWRGTVFEDLGPPEFATAEATRLEQLRLVAVESRIDADLALGNHHAVVAELERLVLAHPFHEGLHCQSMLALYRSGRQADALAIASSVRRRLAEELGVDPGPALRGLEMAILRHDPGLLPTDGDRGDVAVPGVPPGALTKYCPPTPARAQITRARLTDRLRTGNHRRLIVIHGPAGFGKTTLAAQWREVLADEGVTVAWLTIDSDDNNVVWFLAHLLEAVRHVRPTLAVGLQRALEVRGNEAGRYVLASLINTIHEAGERIAIIIDDWHRITSAATIEALTYLLDRGGDLLQLVVTSRTRGGLPMSRMRMLGELLEIDSSDLRFDLSEARAFLVDVAGLALDERDVAHLEQTTDGWVAALQLASLSLRDCIDPAAMINRMSGRHHAIDEYLAENVLDSLAPETLDFLMATSITERVSGDLACSLAGVGHGQALLEQAESQHLFLRRLDDDREWFCYHHLFAEFLLRRLERDQPERIVPLHGTASRWFAEHNLIREAVDHAIAAGEDERAVELMELHGIDLTQRGRTSTLLALVSKLPSDLLARSPRLQLMAAWANMLLQRPAAAFAALDAFEPAAERRGLSAPERHNMRVEADVIRAVMQCGADRTEGVNELISECLSRPETLAADVVASAALVASFLEIYRFDFDAARRWQDWADPYHRRANGPFTLIYRHCLAGMAANEELDITTAERSFQTAVQVAEQSEATASHAARLAYALLGALLYERGDIAEAERLLGENYQLGQAGGVVDNMVARYVIGARIEAMRGDRVAAAGLLNDGAEVAVARGLSRLRAHVDNERSRLGLPVAPSRPSEPRLPDGGLGEITAQLRDEAEIRALMTDQPGQACERAQAWVQQLQRQARPRALLQANRLYVECLSAAARAEEAKETLAALAAQCAERGMARYLLDGGSRVVALLGELRDDLHCGRWNASWSSVPPAFLERMVSANARPAGLQ
ncbi:MAG TPA: BTAD domain-containing putative transcriptional regulator [Mycobacterium sp.]|nr:BTAD domain-containing putative transcriptional regulator [Mycobacterium sp.]